MCCRLGKLGALGLADGGDLQGKWAGAEFLFMAFDVLVEGFQRGEGFQLFNVQILRLGLGSKPR